MDTAYLPVLPLGAIGHWVISGKWSYWILPLSLWSSSFGCADWFSSALVTHSPASWPEGWCEGFAQGFPGGSCRKTSQKWWVWTPFKFLSCWLWESHSFGLERGRSNLLANVVAPALRWRPAWWTGGHQCADASASPTFSFSLAWCLFYDLHQLFLLSWWHLEFLLPSGKGSCWGRFMGHGKTGSRDEMRKSQFFAEGLPTVKLYAKCTMVYKLSVWPQTNQ